MLSCKNVPAIKEKINGLGISLTIIKNLDEYQFLICKYIPGLSDPNIFKFKFQKIRLLIFLFVYKFTKILNENKGKSHHSLEALNKSGNGILQETSELIQVFREASDAESFNIDRSKNFETQINLKMDYFIHFAGLSAASDLSRRSTITGCWSAPVTCGSSSTAWRSRICSR